MSIIANEKSSRCIYIATLSPQERCEAIADLIIENDKLRECVEFYADNWFKIVNGQLISRMYEDQGRKATKTLGEL